MSIQIHETLQTRESTWMRTLAISLEHIHEARICDAKKSIVIYIKSQQIKHISRLNIELTAKYQADFI